MRNKARRDTVVEPDLGTLGSCHGRKISVSGQEQIPMDQEPGAGAGAGDSDHGGGFVRENGGFHSLGLSHAFAETPRVSQNAHFGMALSNGSRSELRI
jgi:hypothetical protein